MMTRPGTLRRLIQDKSWQVAGICALVLILAAAVGRRPSFIFLAVPFALTGILILMRWPILGLLGLLVVALLIPIEIGTGTEVSLNLAALLVPALLSIWLMISLVEHRVSLVPSRVNLPLILFLLMGLLSIVISNLTWDPTVPRSDRFIIVQLAQWALFAFSAGAFWLMGNLVKNERWLHLITFSFVIFATALALVRIMPGTEALLQQFATLSVNRAPFWLLLGGLAAGQLLYNRNLSGWWRGLMAVALAAALIFVFLVQRDRSSNWVGVAAAVGVILCLRYPLLKRLTLVVVLILTASGLLFRIIYDFAGGADKWQESGASRTVLIDRVIELSMRNPITGLGPAAYRPYGLTQPLAYEGAFWVEPQLNTHNNYADLFSQVGILGTAIFLWFMGELAWLLWKMQKKFPDGFAGGFASSLLGISAGIMAIMALADWFLPFVYNIGFPGFQISVLVWMFLGGAIVLEQMPGPQLPQSDQPPA
jgi:hypothetical protein